MAITIQLIRQYTYGEMACANCHFSRTFHAVRRKDNKPCHLSLSALQRFAREDGWTQNRRRQWVCPTCSKMNALTASLNSQVKEAKS